MGSFKKTLSLKTSMSDNDIEEPGLSSRNEGQELQPRESFRVTKYLTEESDSDSDEELSAEAKSILKKRKKEQERLSKLGKMIPICTSESVAIMETYSRTTPFRLNH